MILILESTKLYILQENKDRRRFLKSLNNISNDNEL